MNCGTSFASATVQKYHKAYQRNIFVFLVQNLQNHWDPFGVVVKLIVIIAISIPLH